LNSYIHLISLLDIKCMMVPSESTQKRSILSFKRLHAVSDLKFPSETDSNLYYHLSAMSELPWMRLLPSIK
jgi:hypothetical protein